jgi:hypothetical protein
MRTSLVEVKGACGVALGLRGVAAVQQVVQVVLSSPVLARVPG